MTVHAGRRAEDSLEGPPPPPEAFSVAESDEVDPFADDPAVTDGRIILDLIGSDATSQDVGELIVALGMLGAILAEEAGAATGRPVTEVLHEIALRYAA